MTAWVSWSSHGGGDRFVDERCASHDRGAHAGPAAVDEPAHQVAPAGHHREGGDGRERRVQETPRERVVAPLAAPPAATPPAPGRVRCARPCGWRAPAAWPSPYSLTDGRSFGVRAACVLRKRPRSKASRAVARRGGWASFTVLGLRRGDGGRDPQSAGMARQAAHRPLPRWQSADLRRGLRLVSTLDAAERTAPAGLDSPIRHGSAGRGSASSWSSAPTTSSHGYRARRCSEIVPGQLPIAGVVASCCASGSIVGFSSTWSRSGVRRRGDARR